MRKSVFRQSLSSKIELKPIKQWGVNVCENVINNILEEMEIRIKEGQNKKVVEKLERSLEELMESIKSVDEPLVERQYEGGIEDSEAKRVSVDPACGGENVISGSGKPVVKVNEISVARLIPQKPELPVLRKGLIPLSPLIDAPDLLFDQINDNYRHQLYKTLFRKVAFHSNTNASENRLNQNNKDFSFDFDGSKIPLQSYHDKQIKPNIVKPHYQIPKDKFLSKANKLLEEKIDFTKSNSLAEVIPSFRHIERESVQKTIEGWFRKTEGVKMKKHD